MANEKESKQSDSMSVLVKSLGLGNEYAKRGGELDPVDYLPTGQVEIDAILASASGVGVPRGTVLELAGESQSGKSYVSFKIMAAAMKRGERVCYINVESSFYPPRAEQVGVNTNDAENFLLIENLETAEQYGEIVIKLIDSKMFSVIVVDSISAMIPQGEYEKSLEDPSTIGLHARFTKRFVSKLLGRASRTGTIVVLINQLYMGAGKMPGSMMLTATGGNAMNFMPHMRLWFSRVGGAAGKVLDADGVVVGGKSKVTLQKTRYSEPWIDTEFPIMFGTASSDAVAEFVFRAKARGAEYIKEVRKVYKYPAEGTEIISTKDPVKLIRGLQGLEPPAERTRNDKSTNALEYICGRLRMNQPQMDLLLETCAFREAQAETAELD